MGVSIKVLAGTRPAECPASEAAMWEPSETGNSMCRFLVTLDGQMTVINSSSFPPLLRTQHLLPCSCSLLALGWPLCCSRYSVLITVKYASGVAALLSILALLQIKAFGWAGLLCALVSLANTNSADMDAKAYMSSAS